MSVSRHNQCMSPSATVQTVDGLCIASPIDQYQYLGIRFKMLLDLGHKYWTQSCFKIMPTNIEDIESWHFRRPGSVREFVQQIALSVNVVQGLQRRSCAPQDTRDLQEVRPNNCHVASGVSQRVILLVRSVVLFIDHDQAQVFERRKNRGSGADYDAVFT